MLTFGVELSFALCSTIFFACILLLASTRLKSFSQGSFVISTFHAVSMILLTSRIIFLECWESNHVHCHFDSHISSEFQQFVLLYSFGYFMVDSVVVLWLVPDISASLHHVSILLGLSAAVFSGDFTEAPVGTSRLQYTGSSGYPLAVFLFAAEISAPFLNAFMSGLTAGTSLDFAARGIFAVTFLISRMIVCPILTYKFVMNCPNAHVIPKAVCLFVMCISYYWSKHIIKGIFDAFSDKESKKDSARIKGE